MCNSGVNVIIWCCDDIFCTEKVRSVFHLLISRFSCHISERKACFPPWDVSSSVFTNMDLWRGHCTHTSEIPQSVNAGYWIIRWPGGHHPWENAAISCFFFFFLTCVTSSLWTVTCSADSTDINTMSGVKDIQTRCAHTGMVLHPFTLKDKLKFQAVASL